MPPPDEDAFRQRRQAALGHPCPFERALLARKGLGRAVELLLGEHVAADDAELTTAFDEQARDVVVAHQQHVDRQVLAIEEQLVAALAEGEAGAAQQGKGILREPARLLHGDAQAFAGVAHRALPLRDARAGFTRAAATA